MNHLLLRQLANLTKSEKEKMQVIIEEMFFPKNLLEKKPHDESKPRPNCPDCNSYTVKNGYLYGKQKYKCSACSRTFITEDKRGLIERMYSPEKIKAYIPYLLEGYSLKKCAELTGINVNSAETWRRRIFIGLEQKYQSNE